MDDGNRTSSSSSLSSVISDLEWRAGELEKEAKKLHIDLCAAQQRLQNQLQQRKTTHSTGRSCSSALQRKTALTQERLQKTTQQMQEDAVALQQLRQDVWQSNILQGGDPWQRDRARSSVVPSAAQLPDRRDMMRFAPVSSRSGFNNREDDSGYHIDQDEVAEDDFLVSNPHVDADLYRLIKRRRRLTEEPLTMVKKRQKMKKMKKKDQEDTRYQQRQKLIHGSGSSSEYAEKTYLSTKALEAEKDLGGDTDVDEVEDCVQQGLDEVKTSADENETEEKPGTTTGMMLSMALKHANAQPEDTTIQIPERGNKAEDSTSQSGGGTAKSSTKLLQKRVRVLLPDPVPSWQLRAAVPSELTSVTEQTFSHIIPFLQWN